MLPVDHSSLDDGGWVFLGVFLFFLSFQLFVEIPGLFRLLPPVDLDAALDPAGDQARLFFGLSRSLETSCDLLRLELDLTGDFLAERVFGHDVLLMGTMEILL